MQKYTIRDFQNDFPNDETCLEWLIDYRWPDGLIPCKVCNAMTKHHRVKSRRSVSCQKCGHHVHPTADTIFHKSTTSLTLWFYTIYLMAQTRGGISAKQIERETGVTYKTAWRMCKLIRERLDEDGDPFGGEGGEVEADEAYFGGRREGSGRGRGTQHKTPVLGMAERKGRVKAVAVPDIKGKTLLPIMGNHIVRGTTVYTDEFPTYKKLPRMGYDHRRIYHSAKVYVMGRVHTNTIEGFWSLVKGGIRGVYHHVSAKYLQNYLNEYAFRYNHRSDDTPMFLTFLRRAGLRVQ